MKGIEIYKARKKLGMTLIEFAKAVGLRGKYAERTVRRWQKEETRPRGGEEMVIKQLMKDRGIQ